MEELCASMVYLHELELKYRCPYKFLESTTIGINVWKSSIKLIIQLRRKLGIPRTALLLAKSYLNRFLCKFNIKNSIVKIASCTALLIASKIDMVNAPNLLDFSYETRIHKLDLLRMEICMLTVLDYELHTFTEVDFLCMIHKVLLIRGEEKMKEFIDVCNYFLEISMMSYYCASALPSNIAAAVSIFSCTMLSIPIPSKMFENSTNEINSCISAIYLNYYKYRNNSCVPSTDKLLTKAPILDTLSITGAFLYVFFFVAATNTI